MSQQSGYLAEIKARDYLTTQGLTWITSNFRCRMGEIDLIMQEQANLVFIEVRNRTSAHFGGAMASVTYSKKQKIIKSALYYLMTHQLMDKQPVRFDVVGIEGEPPVVTWVKNAFGTDF